MPQFLLIRHAAVDGLGERIHGRTPGIRLNEQGKREAVALAEQLNHARIARVYSSPRERAEETARALTHQLGVRVSVDAGLDELDYGDWTGRRFSELRESAEWRQFNLCREHVRIPNGESMAETARRTERVLQRVQMLHPEDSVALVTHADWIRTALCHSLQIPFAQLLKLEIPTASVTVLDLGKKEFRVWAWNDGEQPTYIPAILEMRGF